MRSQYAEEGLFDLRLNRFLCLAKIRGKQHECFLPNPGRLTELLNQGRKILVLPKKRQGRRTAYDLFAVYHANLWVVVDSRVPNFLVYEALKERLLPEFADCREIIKEPVYNASRLDFLLKGRGKPWLLEVKSCTLVKRGVALFPDAPTERGQRHVKELISASNNGFRTCILFLIQRNDARVFSPNYETDEKFGKALRMAAEKGVLVLAYSSTFDGTRISLAGRLPIRL